MLDLNALPAYYIGKYTPEKIAEATSALPSTVVSWVRKGAFPVEALQSLLAFDPAPLEAIRPLYTNPAAGEKLVILIPLSGPPAPKMMDCLVKLYDRREMNYERFAFNCLSVSRNVLAARFLRGPWKWAWWQDGDTIVPCGDAAWFKDAAEVPQMPDIFAEVNSILRALVHKKTIVSCCYIAKRKGGPPQFGGGELAETKARVRRGPRNELIEVPWAGMGGMLTHRSVFEDIIKTQGDEIRMKTGGIGTRFGFQYAFFNPIDIETCGDDVPFGIRAARAAHKTFVDLAIHGAHIGDRAWTFQDL